MGVFIDVTALHPSIPTQKLKCNRVIRMNTESFSLYRFIRNFWVISMTIYKHITLMRDDKLLLLLLIASLIKSLQTGNISFGSHNKDFYILHVMCAINSPHSLSFLLTFFHTLMIHKCVHSCT